MEVGSGAELLARIQPKSARNGAAMRSVPLGLLKDKTQVLSLAREQAAVTHDTEMGIRSSCAVALAAHFGLQMKGRLGDLQQFLESESLSEWDYSWCGAVPVEAYPTVSAAFTCLLRNNSLAQLLLDCVGLCGDTDSVAAIAVGLASCFKEYDLALPEHLVLGLREPRFGIEFLATLDRRLSAKYLG